MIWFLATIFLVFGVVSCRIAGFDFWQVEGILFIALGARLLPLI